MEEENKKKNTIHIYSVAEIVSLSKMFKEHTQGELQCLTLKHTDLKFLKKDLSLHSSDLDKENCLIAFVMIDTEEKIHRMWFKLVSYRTTDFDSWRVFEEAIEYRK